MSTNPPKPDAVTKAADKLADQTNERADALATQRAAELEAVATDKRETDARNEKADYRSKFLLPITLALIASLQVVGLAWISTYGARLSRVEVTGEKTHELVNSGSLVQLKLNAELSHWKADQTGNESDIRAAEAADKLVEEHIEKQRKADEGKGKS